MTSSTRDRLLDVGIQLIAERGYRSVTVGDIEAEAGFAARGGTLYRHFSSKAELLDTAMRRHIESVGQFDDLLVLLPLPDLRSELSLLGRWLLVRLSGEESITRIVEKESARFPHLIDAMREDLSDAGYRLASAYLEQRGLDQRWDSDAVAVILLGSLINLRRSTWTFGKPPNGLDDDRVLVTWVELGVALLDPAETRANTDHPT
jgi:AcrR family transcriptional regulator